MYVHCLYADSIARTLKDTRWNMRVAPDADAVVRQAAALSHRKLTEFVIDAAVVEAERVLADRTRFVLDPERWGEFVELLDRPVQENPELAMLFARPSVFE